KAKYDTPAKMGTLAFSAQRAKPEVGESQRSHLRRRVVLRLVAVAHRRPTARDGVSADESRVVAGRVAGHVAVDVAVVPRRHLRVEDLADGREILLRDVMLD